MPEGVSRPDVSGLPVAVVRLDRDLPLPSYAHPGDAGADLVTAVDVVLEPGERGLVPTGISIALPEGYVALVHPRSGLAARHGLTIVNTPGTIDAGYRGEVKVLLINHDPAEAIRLRRGDRIAQLVVQRFERAAFIEVDALPESVRGIGGYGSTGIESRQGSPGLPPEALRRQPSRPGDALMFRRKSRPQPDDLATGEPGPQDPGPQDPDTDGPGPQDPGTESGPWDVDDMPDDGVDRIDVGSLLVPTVEGAEVRLQVDELTGQVQSVMVAGEDGALELRAFAAPRNGDLWSEIRPQIAADIAQHGGTATERGGRWGLELVCNMQVLMPDGTQGIQPSRIVGVNGSRWLLRGTFLGRPAVEADDSAAWEDALAAVAVRRGDHAMPVGDALPLVLPPDAQRAPSP